MSQQQSPADFTAEMERFRALGRSAFVTGYSGVAGKALVAELNKANIFKKVVLIGRREIPLEVGPEFEQRVVDFEKIEEHKDAFQDLDVGFWCMGVHSKDTKLFLCAILDKDAAYVASSSSCAMSISEIMVNHLTRSPVLDQEDYVHFTRDYGVSFAQVAKEQGCKHFNVITAKGSSKNSWIVYSRVKAELEEKLEELNFDRLSIFQPALILGDRENKRASEAISKALFKPVISLFPTLLSVPDNVFARGMIVNAVRPSPNPPSREIYENKNIHGLAKS